MHMSRRQLAGAVVAAAVPSFASAARAVGFEPFGTLQAPAVDRQHASEIIGRLPKDDYRRVMAALAALDRTEKPGSTGEPFNRRWHGYANPLLVQIWRDMGYPASTDCDAWCGVTLGWCLKRAGWRPPKDCASSQSYLLWGAPVTDPAPGDLCVFTNVADSAHGHVTIFQKALPIQKAVLVLGANQKLSEPTNCPGDIGVNVVDERPMPIRTKSRYLNKYIRPPARI